MVTKRTGNPPGQPRKPLAQRPGRYLYAEFEAWIRRWRDEDGLSELKAIGALALMLSADFTPDDDSPMGFVLTSSRRRQEKGDNAGHYRYGASHLPLADDLIRTLRGFRDDPEAAAWFVPMAAAWRIVIDGRLEMAPVARALAASVGEEAHFDDEMAPALRVWSVIRGPMPRRP